MAFKKSTAAPFGMQIGAPFIEVFPNLVPTLPRGNAQSDALRHDWVQNKAGRIVAVGAAIFSR